MSSSLSKREANRQRRFDRIETWKQSDLTQKANTRVYLAAGSTDMRKAVNGLMVLVCDVFESDPFSSHLFVFCNRLRDRIKILYWHNNGFWLFYRRLERQRFWWPAGGEQAPIEITSRELSWLLEGLDVTQVKAHKTASFPLF